MEVNIDVPHMARVEGHGDIRIKVKNGKLLEAKWIVVETPRFFEAIVRGKSVDMAPYLTSRICGVCSVGHTLTSIRAIERALQIEVPGPAKLLRMLARHGETLQSHFLHIFFLVAPDLFDLESVIPMVNSHPDVLDIALKLRGLGNEICSIVGGRSTHALSMVVGGFTKVPEKKRLEVLKNEIKQNLPNMMKTVELFEGLPMPDFERETEYVSLRGQKSYPWIGGDLISSDGVKKTEDDYLDMTNEYKETFTMSKSTKLSRQSFAVGALARFNNNHQFLKPEAKDVASTLNLKPANHNPFMNNIAQIVECYHVMLESIDIIDQLLDCNLKDIYADYTARESEAVGAVEAPRGILYHYYKIGSSGVVAKANCIIPTTQNNANIYHDLAELVKQQVDLGKSDTQITRLSEMLVRAYDPCISCSVH